MSGMTELEDRLKLKDAMPYLMLTKKHLRRTFCSRLLVAVDHVAGDDGQGSFGGAIGEWHEV